MPNILSQIGPDSLASLKKLAESYQAMGGGMGGMGGMPGMGGAAEGAVDDEVPDTVSIRDKGVETEMEKIGRGRVCEERRIEV